MAICSTASKETFQKKRKTVIHYLIKLKRIIESRIREGLHSKGMFTA